MERSPNERRLLRGLNVALVAGLLRRHQPVSRAELAERAGLARSTITGITALLLREGLARETGEAESTGGRKPVLLELVAEARLVAAVRLTARTMTLGLTDLSGRLLVRHRRALRGDRQPEEVLSQVSTWVTEMLREYGPESERVLGVGISLPGRVRDGVLLQSEPLGWREVAVQAEMEQRLGLPVLAENEANALALGELRHGAGRGCSNLVAVTLGGGVGGGLIAGGAILRGRAGAAGELGHVQVDEAGPRCWCGRKGCLEALVSDEALAGQALLAIDRGADSLLLEMVEGRRQAVTREAVVAAAQDGDPLCRRLLEQAGHRIGTVLAQVANALAPDLLVLGGEAVEQAGPLLMEPIRQALHPRLVPWVAGLRVEAGALGEAACLIGVAEQALDRVFQLPLYQPEAEEDPLNIAIWLPEE
ncbi:MAG: ROK family transcriptional regulator [Bacillota bacterium]